MIEADVKVRFLIDTDGDGFTVPDDDYTNRLASFTGTRGFEYNPVFAFKDGTAQAKLKNDDKALHGVIDLNQAVKFQVYNDLSAEWQTVWSGFIDSYERETGATAAFLNISCSDGVLNIREMGPQNSLYINEYTADIIADLMKQYTNPVVPRWVLGRARLGSSTLLGGVTLDVIGDKTRTPRLSVYVPERSGVLKSPTRISDKKINSVDSAIEDLLNVDGSILYLDAEGEPHLLVYKGELTNRMQSGSPLSLDTEANKSVFRSVLLRQIVTVGQTRYETHTPIYGAVARDDSGFKLPANGSETKSLNILDDVFVTGAVFSADVVSAGSLTTSIGFDGELFSITLTDTSGAENQVSSIAILGDGYKFTENEYEKRDNALSDKYGTRERSLSNGAIETEAQAQALVSRMIAYNGKNLNRIKFVVFEKRFVQEALELEIADVVVLSESASNITALPHLITGFDYTWTPNNLQVQAHTEVIEPRMWVLGSSRLGTETYI